MDRFNLERDLINSDIVRAKVQTDRTFANELYAALCNVQFVHRDMDHPETDYWSCSWRYAGDIVSHIEAVGGDYMDYYCAGSEGTFSPRVAEVLASLGWAGRPWPEDA
jgi:hypothetical protein